MVLQAGLKFLYEQATAALKRKLEPRADGPQAPVHLPPIFHDDSDYLVYMRNLKNSSTEHDLRIDSYSLMTNHIHLIAVPKTDVSISRALHPLYGWVRIET